MIKYDLTKAVCYKKIHCTLCRRKDESGKKFREDIVRHLVEQIDVDFECPQGYEWDSVIEPEIKPASIPLPEKTKSLMNATTSENVKLTTERFEICKTCDKASKEGHKCSLHKGCCFGRWRSKPENKCPEGKW